MFNINEIDLDVLNISHKEMDNQLLEFFGYQYLEDALRIIHTGHFTPKDAEVIHDAMCIVMSIYIRKVKSGEINKDIWIH